MIRRPPVYPLFPYTTLFRSTRRPCIIKHLRDKTPIPPLPYQRTKTMSYPCVLNTLQAHCCVSFGNTLSAFVRLSFAPSWPLPSLVCASRPGPRQARGSVQGHKRGTNTSPVGPVVCRRQGTEYRPAW